MSLHGSQTVWGPGDQEVGLAWPGDGVSQLNPGTWAPACSKMTLDACDDHLPSK